MEGLLNQQPPQEAPPQEAPQQQATPPQGQGGLLDPNQFNSKRMEDFKNAFQLGYRYMSSGKNFETLLKHAQSDPIGAVTQYISVLTKLIVKERKITDAEALYYAMTAIISDAVDKLREKNIPISDDDLMMIINKSVQRAMRENPEITEDAKKNPGIQKYFEKEMNQGEANNGVKL